MRPRITGWAFVVLSGASTIWIVVGYLTAEHALMVQNVGNVPTPANRRAKPFFLTRPYIFEPMTPILAQVANLTQVTNFGQIVIYGYITA